MNNENRDPTSNSQQSNTALPLLKSFYQAQIIGKIHFNERSQLSYQEYVKS